MPAAAAEARLRAAERAARRRAFPLSGDLMSDPRLDVLTIGNAIVDVIADATDDFLEPRG